MPTDKELLAESRAKIAELTEILERLSDGALSFGTILAKDKDGKRMTLASGGSLSSVLATPHAVGETVFLAPMTGQILSTAEYPMLGAFTEILSVHDYGALVSSQGKTSIVGLGKHKGLVEAGDRVMLDPSGSIITAVLPREKPAHIPTVEKVTWADIGGQDEAKRLLIEAVEHPRKHPEIFKHYGAEPTRGVLLSGPPGCGKTMLGKAVANSIGAGTGGFILCKGPEVLDPYVGVAEANVRNLFRMAEAHKAKTGADAVIFIDEAEAIMARRGSHHAYMEKTIVPTFLTEMDGLEKSSAVVILATNRSDLLDPAVIRDGRIDYKVEVCRPSKGDAYAIMDIHIGKKPVKGNRDDVIRKSIDGLYTNSRLPYSGALIAGLVKKAAARAMARDVASGKRSGLCPEDFAAALDTIQKQESIHVH